MDSLSNLIFSVSCEVEMAQDVLQMCIDRMSGTAPEVGGAHAALILLARAREKLETCEKNAGLAESKVA